MLITPRAIADVIELVTAGDFYRPAHGHVFDAIVSLYGQGPLR